MKRHVSGLAQASASPVEGLPDGLFLVRIERAQYRWHAQKPYYGFVFSVLEPKSLAGNRFSGRLYCTPKALWKLNRSLTTNAWPGKQEAAQDMDLPAWAQYE